ncbi:solute carrier family 25 member 45-like isoform X2 [Pomacea canaliculata]|uniref:solute carrier family 25 member 45-like isoform X2 n=1 Tax=Pomacea canaliculata TaxID=400727 RepID=UPI000D7319E7|nr:solute carrier family 25 member 45-like isoform X2 [Pomacea canaliculata]
MHCGKCGGCYSAVAIVCGHPFDTTKVRLHLDIHKKTPAVYNVLETLRHHGMGRGLFRGLSFPLATSFVSNSFLFAVYCSSLHAMQGNTQRVTHVTHSAIFLAGCIGGAAQLVVSCPSDVIKIMLQSDIPIGNGTVSVAKTRCYLGPMECIGEVLRYYGWRGLYRGLGAMAARDLPGYGLYLLFFQHLEDLISNRETHDPYGVYTGFVAGGIAGSMSWGLLTPFDVIKSRLQADVMSRQYKGFWDCLQSSVSQHGLRVLYRAFLPTVIRAFPSGAWSGFFYNQTAGAMETLWSSEATRRRLTDITSRLRGKDAKKD